MKGYKVFNPDWTCRGYQFEVGKTFTEDVTPACCDSGFHFCTKVVDCFEYYAFKPNNKVAEVEALGDIDADKYSSKCCTNKIHIIRELTWNEVLDLVNLGQACTGLRNSGNYNSGNRNSGNCNRGNGNSGNCNSGNRNGGNGNDGDLNSGNCNHGNRNSGNCNSGNYNSGDWNRGNCNNGDCNSGSCNSGDYNSGDCNSGDHNKGNYNSGDWNNTCYSNGCFNTKSPKIFLFNKPSGWTLRDWLDSEARYILMNCPSNSTQWVQDNDMTDKEKKEHLEYSVTSGFLKNIEREGERQEWWDGLAKESKDIVMSLPNFDKDIFKEITGIDVNKFCGKKG